MEIEEPFDNDNLVPKKVTILLASYNGHEFIGEQLESICSQDYYEWELLVSDDGSHDCTVAVIQEYAKVDSRIKLLSISDRAINSAQNNFFALMEEAIKAVGDIFLLADQDDVWERDKLSTFVQKVNEIGEDWCKIPCLIYSDLQVVNNDLSTIHPSFMKYMGICHQDSKPWQMLTLQNFVTGCACGFNKKLLFHCLPQNKYSVMHDWWLAINAALYGRIEFISRPLIQYRQHINNQVGAKGNWCWLNPFKPDLYDKLWNSPKDLRNAILQSKAAIECASNSPVKRFSEERHLELLTVPRVKRPYVAWKLGLKMQHWLLTLVVYVLLPFVNFED